MGLGWALTFEVCPWQVLADVARERGMTPTDLLLDLALETDLETRFRMPVANHNEDEVEPLLALMARANPTVVSVRECPQDRQVRSYKQGVYNSDRSPVHDILRRAEHHKEAVGGGLTAELLRAVLEVPGAGTAHGDSCGAVPAPGTSSTARNRSAVRPPPTASLWCSARRRTS